MTNPPPPPPNSPYQQSQPYVAPSGQFDDGPEKKSWVPGCLMGCLIAAGVCTILCAGVGFYAYKNASQWAINTARSGVEAVLADSDMDAKEQEAILTQFDRVATAYQEGDITLEEMGQLMEDLGQSPLMSVIVFEAMETKYLNSSGLTEEEQEEAKITLARIVRGAQEQKLDQVEIENLSRHIMTDPDEDDPDQTQELKSRLSDEELRAFFAEAKQLADDKEIPQDVVPQKLSEVIRGVVDEALAK